MELCSGSEITVTCLNDAAQVAAELAARLLQKAHVAIKQRDEFHCVLAGGTTPQQAYGLLQNADVDWSQWHLYLGDERVLPIDDPNRNSTMIETIWLQKLNDTQPHWHPIPTELGMDTAVDFYTQILVGVEKFDMVLLGMGEDGHTASLFPAQQVTCNATKNATVELLIDKAAYPIF